MDNRVEKYFTEDHAEPLEFWTVNCDMECYCVDADTALALMTLIERRWPPRWLRFRDAFGELVSVRTRDVRSVIQSTTEGRSLGRVLRERLHAEEPQNRPW